MPDDDKSSPGADQSLLTRLANPYLLLVLTTLFWGGNWVMGRAIRHSLSPIEIAFWRWFLAWVIFMPWAWPHMRNQKWILAKNWKLLLMFGLLGSALYHTLVYTALAGTTAINASLVNSVMPVVIVALSWLIFGERIGPRQILGILSSLAGVVVIVSQGSLDALLAVSFNPGDLWALASIPAWALYSVMLRIRPPDLHPSAFLGAIMSFGVLLLIPVYYLDSGFTFEPVPWEVTAGVVYMSIFASVLAYVFWNRAVGQIGANKAGHFIHLLPVFGTVLAMIFLGEAFRSYHGTGIVLIVTGIYLATLSGRRTA